MSVMESNGIPTTILTGFLGSGKTTYLNQLLQRGVPDNSLVLVNDFGQINVDAELITYQDDQIIRLNNGCVCCTLGGSMAEKLAEIGRLNPLPSAIYIEISGVANAVRVADMIQVSSRFQLQDVWCFVDVSLAQRYSEDLRVSYVWQQQILSATQLVLNRLSSQSELPAALAALVEQSSASVHYDYVSKKDIVESVVAASPTMNATGGWYSFSFESITPVPLAELKQLIRLFAADLYRAKGMCVSTEDNSGCVLQYTGGQLRITPSFKPVQKTQLIFIGESQARLQLLQQKLQELVQYEPA